MFTEEREGNYSKPSYGQSGQPLQEQTLSPFCCHESGKFKTQVTNVFTALVWPRIMFIGRVL
jgi:hypothetical protein